MTSSPIFARVELLVEGKPEMGELEGDVDAQPFGCDAIEDLLVAVDDGPRLGLVADALPEQRRVREKPLLVQAAQDDDGLVERLAGDEPAPRRTACRGGARPAAAAGSRRRRESPSSASGRGQAGTVGEGRRPVESGWSPAQTLRHSVRGAGPIGDQRLASSRVEWRRLAPAPRAADSPRAQSRSQPRARRRAARRRRARARDVPTSPTDDAGDRCRPAASS